MGPPISTDIILHIKGNLCGLTFYSNLRMTSRLSIKLVSLPKYVIVYEGFRIQKNTPKLATLGEISGQTQGDMGINIALLYSCTRYHIIHTRIEAQKEKESNRES